MSAKSGMTAMSSDAARRAVRDLELGSLGQSHYFPSAFLTSSRAHVDGLVRSRSNTVERNAR